MDQKQEAWMILTKDEQVSLSLSFGHDKSTWESGEIMNKSHYKFLEIKQRAERFFKLFNHYLESYDKIIPKEANISKTFREYLEYLIMQRKSRKETIFLLEDPAFKSKVIREEMIILEMAELSKSKREADLDLYNLVKEFDRWNAFRILPPAIQEPSAYKRRGKIRNLKHLRNITQLPDITLDMLIKRFDEKDGEIFVPLVSTYFEEGYRILTIKNTIKNIKDLTSIGLFIYKDMDTAYNAALLIRDYIFKKEKRPSDGQRFWPQFRVSLSKTVNYANLENIDPSRKNMENAFVAIDIKYVKRLKKKEQQLFDRKFLG